METRPPTITRILIAVAFAISCFAIALFLWIAFGGPVPLKPESYRFAVPFEEATQLAEESDVRISGVSVGKVKSIELGEANDAVAVIELEPRYAPIPESTEATLRSKTLLGETYVELTPGDSGGADLPEGGSLPAAHVAESVQLDEIFRAFDEPTRAAFQAWMQGQAAAFEGRGDDFSVAIASLDPFAEQANELLRVLDSQRLAVRRFVADGGEVFQALSERRGQLRGLIESSETVFSTTAARDAELAETFRVFPTFLRESRATLARLERFSRDTDPLVQQLRPAARELSPTLIDLGRLAPELEGFFVGLRGAIDAAPGGFGALRALLGDDLPPFLARANGFFAELNSILEVAELYKREITAFFANAAAATNGGLAEPDGEFIRYLRTTAPLNPETLASFPIRVETNRANPYTKPGGYGRLAQGLASFGPGCGGGVRAELSPSTPSDPDFSARVDGNATEAQDLFDRIRRYAFADQLSTADVPAPPCVEQPDFDSIGEGAERSEYLHVRRQP